MDDEAHRVLVADEHPGVLDALKRGDRWDLILLDLSMPGGEGTDLVEKSAGVEQLLTAARRVLEGDTYVSPDLASRFADALAGGRAERRHERLSGREFQVLRLFGEGKSVSEIAELLSLSVKTVSTYRSRVLEKMEMDSTAELIRYAIDRGLVRQIACCGITRNRIRPTARRHRT